MKLVKRIIEFLQVSLPVWFKLTLEPPDIITHLPGKVLVKRVLICRNVEYALEDLSESSARTLIESYSALLKSLPAGVHIHVLKEELNTEKLLKKISNNILNTQVDLESTSDEVRRVRLQAKLSKLKSLYEALLKGRPFIKATLIITFTVSDSNLGKAKSLADYYESVIQDLFQKHFNLQLERATREEILKFMFEFFSLSKDISISPIIVETSRLAYFQPLIIDKFTPTHEAVIIGFAKDSLHPVGLKSEELYYHLTVIGPTGRGKTTLLASIVEQTVTEDCARIYAVDFKGDLENYLAPGILMSIVPEKLPLHFLKPPPGISPIDWRSIVLDAVSHITSLPVDKISSALSALERASGPEQLLRSHSASLLLRFLEFIENNPDYNALEDVLKGNVVISLKNRGIVFQNTYASLFIGILRNTLLKESRDRGALVLIDDAWRVLKLRSIIEIVREGRSRRVGVIISTQNPEDIPVDVLENTTHFVIFGSRNREYVEKIRQLIGVSEEHAKMLFRFNVGEALYVNTLTRRVELIDTAKPVKLKNGQY